MTFKRSMQFAVASLASATAIKTSIASATTAQSYSGAALNGAMVTANVALPLLGTFTGIAGYPSVTTTAQASAYTLNSTVVFTGLWRGVTTTRTATITSTGAAAAYIADGPLDSVTQIDVAAQAATNGAFTFGWSGIAPTCVSGRWKTWTIVCTTAGNLVVTCGDTVDTVPLIAAQQYLASPQRIFASSTGAYTIYEAD